MVRAPWDCSPWSRLCTVPLNSPNLQSPTACGTSFLPEPHGRKLKFGVLGAQCTWRLAQGGRGRGAGLDSGLGQLVRQQQVPMAEPPGWFAAGHT